MNLRLFPTESQDRHESRPLKFEEAVRQVANELFVLVKNQRRSEHKGSDANFVSDPVIDADTGEVFEISRRIEELMKDEARLKFPSFAIYEMDSQNIGKADYVITGIIPLEHYRDDAGKLRHLSLSVLDRKTGRIVAHSDVWIANADLQFELTAMYRDSPMYLKDKRVEALIATAKATAGSLADEEYFNSLTTNALLNEASSAYDRGAHLQALGLFAKAAERGDGKVMKTFSGLYQSFFKLKKTKEAGQAFASLVELGMRGGKLGVKFLFNVDATEFFGEADNLDEYQIWLREIAKNIVASKNCMQVVGHASTSGTEEHNQALSERRAELIYNRLQSEAPGVDKKATAIGKGTTEVIIGTGTNDASDAIDRRVEFKMSLCGTWDRPTDPMGPAVQEGVKSADPAKPGGAKRGADAIE
jgi:outer membrane protein OmpA-like peptidoglycan-associated protein